MSSFSTAFEEGKERTSMPKITAVALLKHTSLYKCIWNTINVGNRQCDLLLDDSADLEKISVIVY